MGSGSWVVHEGFLLCKEEENAAAQDASSDVPKRLPLMGTSRTSASTSASATRGLTALYVVLTLNRKLEFFDTSEAATRTRVDAASLQGFAGWDGDGRLQVPAYGLELKVERNVNSRMHLAAFNRVDLEKWCRAFMAVLDPQSAAGEEVRRERRRVRKEEKRLQEERDEKIRKWREKKARMIKEEQDRLLAREEEINNMTPLERVDGLGSLDDDTAKMLEKRKLRLQRRQAPTMERVNKAAYRRRMEEAAGGKTDNMQRLQTKVVEQKARIRVDLPPPGQFFEVGGVVHNDFAVRRGSFGSDVSDSSSMSSRLSSVSSAAGSRYDGGMASVPPPPPPLPRWSGSSSRGSVSSRSPMGIPPPPPPPFDPGCIRDGESRLSRSSSSLRSASFDSFAFDRDDESMRSRSSFSQSKSAVSQANRKDRTNMENNLAAILGDGRPRSASRASRRSHRRDSTVSSITTAPYSVPDRTSRTSVAGSNGNNGAESSMANVFAASLVAIRRNRADTVESASAVKHAASPVEHTHRNGKKLRDRNFDSGLSAAKNGMMKTTTSDGSTEGAPSKSKTSATSGRKGLFDDSSSDEDSDTGLFGVGKQASKTVNGASLTSNSACSSDASVDIRPKDVTPAASSSDDEDASSDTDSTSEMSFFAQRHVTDTSAQNTGADNAGVGRLGPNVVVLFKTCALRTEGKKSDGVYTFTLQLGNLEHSFSFTYAGFEAIHLQLTAAFPGMALPKFPSKHRLRNNTKPENMEKRAHEFRFYLQQLVSSRGVLSSKRFQLEYHISGAFAQALANDQKSNPSAASGVRSNGRPPRSPVAPVLSQQSALPASSSRLANPCAQVTKTKASKGLFGLDDSDSDPESNSDTPVDAPKPSTRQQRRESAASLTQKGTMLERSERSSSVLSSVDGDTQRGKKSRSRSRLSSRASSRTSVCASLEPTMKPKVTGLPPGRPNPFAGGHGDLLAAIRQGKQLKNSTDGSAGDSSFQGASTTAKPLSPPPALTQPGSINEAITNAMAMRRIHVEYEETNSNAASDSDDDWD
uniref:PX domain-containing protein n=1 Tax=Peronospora matthiolae TaxID=2874970 RepID=A0AAV1TMS3_9STRA